EDVVQKLFPQRAGRVRVVLRRAEFSDVIFSPVFAQRRGLQLQRPVRAVEQPRIAVHFLGQDGNARLAARQVERRVDARRCLRLQGPLHLRLELGKFFLLVGFSFHWCSFLISPPVRLFGQQPSGTGWRPSSSFGVLLRRSRLPASGGRPRPATS